VDDSGHPALSVEIEDNGFLVHESWASQRTLLVSGEVKNRPQLQAGLINEMLSEVIFIMIDQPL
jgi:hypothetical protein